jgi:hypothetical protein
MSFLHKYTENVVKNAEEGNRKSFRLGENVAWIVDASETFSKMGKEMIEITFGNDDGATIKDYITDNEYAASKLKGLQTAFKIPLGSQNLREWRGKTGIVVCKEGELYKGIAYPKVAYYRSLKPETPSLTQPQQPQPQQPSQEPNPNDDWVDDIPF